MRQVKKPFLIVFFIISIIIVAMLIQPQRRLIAKTETDKGEIVGIVGVSVYAPQEEVKYEVSWVDPDTDEPYTSASWSYSCLLYTSPSPRDRG